MRIERDRVQRKKEKNPGRMIVDESIRLETSYDLEIQEEMDNQIKYLMSEYQFLRHIKCSALNGEHVKTIFDEAIEFMLKKKNAQLFKRQSESGDNGHEKKITAMSKVQSIFKSMPRFRKKNKD